MKRVQGSLVASILALVATAEPSKSQDLATLPAALAAPNGTVVASLIGVGAQIYQCSRQQGSDRDKWALVAPTATLFETSKIVGRHFAGPTWEFSDLTAVRGKVVTSAQVGSAADIPWLKLAIVEPAQGGPVAGATTILRIDTKGGAIANIDCRDAGALHAEPYQATYVFMK